MLEEMGRLCRDVCVGRVDCWGCYSTCLECWERCGGRAWCVERCVSRLAPRRRAERRGGLAAGEILAVCGSLLSGFVSQRASLSLRVIARRLGARTLLVGLLLAQLPERTVVRDVLGRKWVYLGRRNGRALWARLEASSIEA